MHCSAARKSHQYQAADQQEDERDPEHGTQESRYLALAGPLLQHFCCLLPQTSHHFLPLLMVTDHTRLGLALAERLTIFGCVHSFPSLTPKGDI